MSPSAFESLLFRGLQTPFPGWSLVVVQGRDAERFLHSQLTSDIKALADGDSQPTALLDRGGRLRAYGFVARRHQRFEILLPTAIAASTQQGLEEHVIADDVRFIALETPRMRLALGAEAVRSYSSGDTGDRLPVSLLSTRGFVTWGDEDLDLPILGGHEFEALRVVTGFPHWGREVREGQLVSETALVESAVSMSKGCYLGQETVAKVASGRGAARAPMLLEILAGDVDCTDLVGKDFSASALKRAGTVLSAARFEGTAYLQALVTRELRVQGREVNCRFEGGPEIAVRVRPLPLVGTPEPEAWARRLERRAVQEFAGDREEQAIELYERAIAVCPAYADAYEALGVILGRHRRFEEAIALMRRLLEVDPSSVMAHTNLSLYYNQQGRIEDAEREAAEAMRAKLRLEQAERELRSSAQEHAASERAERERRHEMFRQVLELDPDDALGNFGLGELLVEEGRHAEAVAHLERALAADPRYSAALLALGRAHEAAEDFSAARETYRRGVDVAAAKGDLATANKMQERLAVLESASPEG